MGKTPILSLQITRRLAFLRAVFAPFFTPCFYALFFELEGLLSHVLLASLVKFRI